MIKDFIGGEDVEPLVGDVYCIRQLDAKDFVNSWPGARVFTACEELVDTFPLVEFERTKTGSSLAFEEVGLTRRSLGECLARWGWLSAPLLLMIIDLWFFLSGREWGAMAALGLLTFVVFGWHYSPRLSRL